jgi:hypothetical protein
VVWVKDTSRTIAMATGKTSVRTHIARGTIPLVCRIVVNVNEFVLRNFELRKHHVVVTDVTTGSVT